MPRQTIRPPRLVRRPQTDDALHTLVRRLCGLNVPRKPIIEGNAAPFDYLQRAVLHDAPGDDDRDLVVWASRGSGKTMLAAVATLLDMIFKPGIRILLLGGSLDQSNRVYAYLRRLAARPLTRQFVAGEPTRRGMRLYNGSEVEVAAGSQRSVRGARVQKLRCDEVEEFDRDVWDAAQLVTQTRRCGPRLVRGGVEALSTMHYGYGLMQQLTASPGVQVLRWCALDVIARCPPQRDCATCPIEPDCRGRAKHADGFMPVDDVVQMRQRLDDARWDCEMMCRRPRLTESVYPAFSRARHVRDVDRRTGELIAAGVDFGLRHFVMLWAAVRGDALHVLDEHHGENATLENNLDALDQRGWPSPAWIAVDPAGAARNAQTGLSDLAVMRRRGYNVKTPDNTVDRGIGRVRWRLDRDRLTIAPRCTRLIEAMECYRFDRHTWRQQPIKDGHDHFADALRYLVMQLETLDTRVQCYT